MKVLIGFDDSSSSRDAILELHRAGLPANTNATVISCADVWPRLKEWGGDATPASTWDQAPIVRKARALAELAVAEVQEMAAAGDALVRSEFPGWTVSHAAYAGSPSDVLVNRDQAPDLVVVGSQGRSALGRLVLGSVSQRVVMHAPCSVRIGRRSPADAARGSGGAVRIVIGIDGSRHSALAVSAVASRVWPARTEVKVVAALDAKFLAVLAAPAQSPWAAAWTGAPPGEDACAWARDAVEAVAAELRSAGLAVTPVVEEAEPKDLLLREAETWLADCIFLGAKGQGALERFLLGSVTASVAARASCSVEVVRQG